MGGIEEAENRATAILEVKVPVKGCPFNDNEDQDAVRKVLPGEDCSMAYTLARLLRNGGIGFAQRTAHHDAWCRNCDALTKLYQILNS
jgi:hypothetical protein